MPNNQSSQLSNHLASMRDEFGKTLVELGEKDERIVVLTANLGESTRAHLFGQKFPERFFDIGVSEQNLVTVASGIASQGKIPFVTSYASFSPGRNWEQIKTTIALNNLPVKIIGNHAGLSASVYGATHMSMEDIALMRTLPNMVVVSPCDGFETRKAVRAICDNNKPTYLRLSREETPQITKEEDAFELGKPSFLVKADNPQVTVVGTGPILFEVLQAVEELTKNGGMEIEVVNIHTIKPLDEMVIIGCARKSGTIVTVEEHQLAGGLGSAVSEVLSRNFPVPIEMMGINDKFGESGTYQELKTKHGLTKENIIASIQTAIARKLEDK